MKTTKGKQEKGKAPDVKFGVFLATLAALVMIQSCGENAFAMVKTDPVEVVANANGVREIVTSTRFEPDFYCWGIWTTTDHRRILFNDESNGYIFPATGLYLWMPADGVPQKFYDSADFVRAIMDYQYHRYGQEIDGAPIPTAWGADYTYDIFGVDEYITIYERIYGVQ